MRILLADIDHKIECLPLMKLAAYYKANGPLAIS
jgi:hypothetical protein